MHACICIKCTQVRHANVRLPPLSCWYCTGRTINFQRRGTSSKYPNDEFMPKHSISKVALKTARCPSGTVAIRRGTRDDLVRLQSLSSESAGGYLAVANVSKFTPPPTVHVSQVASTILCTICFNLKPDSWLYLFIA